MKIACSLLALALLCSCARAVRVAGNGRLVVAASWEPANLNGIYNDGYLAGFLGSTVYSWLTNYDASGKLVPVVAAQVPSVENGGISSGGRTITFHLRHDVRWADGVPLTAADVVFTFDQIENPNNSVPSRYGYDEVAGVRASGRYTVRFTLRQPDPPAVSLLFGPDGNAAILPKHLLDGNASLDAIPFDAKPTGSGPYRVERWSRGDSMVLAANDRFFLGKPRVRELDVTFVHDQSTIANLLRTGEVQAAFDVAEKNALQLRNLPGHRVVRTMITGVSDVMFNTTHPIVRDARVRRAIAYAIDRATLVKKLYDGQSDPYDGMRGIFTWAYDARASRIPYDPQRSERLLDEAGWRLGPDGIRHKNGRALRLSFLVRHPNENVGTAIAAGLASIGVRLDIKAIGSELADAKTGPAFTGQFALMLYPIVSNVDPDVTWLFSCGERAPNGFNLMRYCNRSLDRILARSVSTTNRAARTAYLGQAQRILARDMPMLALYQAAEFDVVPDSLRNFTPTLAEQPYHDAYAWNVEP